MIKYVGHGLFHEVCDLNVTYKKILTTMVTTLSKYFTSEIALFVCH